MKIIKNKLPKVNLYLKLENCKYDVFAQIKLK